MGMESEDTISAFVGDANPEVGKPVDTKQLFQEISSLKEQVRTQKCDWSGVHTALYILGAHVQL